MGTKKLAPIVNLNVHQVNYTKDLTMFKTIKGNRPLNLLHVNRLIDSIREYGMLLAPIIVNHNYQIIDGQHRLAAAKELSTGIYFIKADKYGMTHVQVMNQNQKNWSIYEYVDSYSTMGLKDYTTLLEFYDTHEVYPITSCAAMLSGTVDGGSQTKKIKSGDFVVSRWLKGNEIAEKLKLIRPFFKYYNNSTFIRVMIQMFVKKEFDFDEFMAKLRIQPTALQKCGSAPQYKALIETIYNYRRKDKVNLRF